MGEWITDRLPTKEDSTINGLVLTSDDSRNQQVFACSWGEVKAGEPWMPYPEPYVAPKQVRQRWQICGRSLESPHKTAIEVFPDDPDFDELIAAAKDVIHEQIAAAKDVVKNQSVKGYMDDIGTLWTMSVERLNEALKPRSKK